MQRGPELIAVRALKGAQAQGAHRPSSGKGGCKPHTCIQPRLTLQQQGRRCPLCCSCTYSQRTLIVCMPVCRVHIDLDIQDCSLLPRVIAGGAWTRRRAPSVSALLLLLKPFSQRSRKLSSSP